MEKGKNIINYITVFGFFLILVFPMINSYTNLIEEEEIQENRQLIAKPEFDPGTLDEYTEIFDHYYSDNFSLRTNLINFLNVYEYRIYGESPKPGLVTVGKDGWFYATKSKANYENAYVYNDETLDKIEKELVARTEWCEKLGAKYYTVIVPNKMNVYPEYLPRTIIKKGDVGIYDQLINFNSNPKINIVGLKESILEHKNDGFLLYQKTGDHWTDYGAFFGYEKILQRLSKDFPELKAQSLNEFDISINNKEGNMAKKISLAEEYPEKFVKMTRKIATTVVPGLKKGYQSDGGVQQHEVEIVKSNPDGKPLKCLIIRDSFTLSMMKYLDEHFQSTVYLHDEWRGRIRKDAIELEKPDIVIVIMLETHVKGLWSNPCF